MKKILPKIKIITHIFKHKRGFTLIELLIVIAIIGVLTTLLMTNFVGVRQRARDAQRKADLRQLQATVQLFHTDNGRYPIRQNTYRINITECPTSESFSYNGVTYMSKVPCDPLGSESGSYNGGNYYYYSSSDGSTYTLAACLENANDNDVNATTTAPSPSASGSCVSGKYYVLNNP